MRLVKVTWFDAHGVAGSWCATSELGEQRRIVTTVGHEVPDAKLGHVVVVLSVDDEGNVDSGVAIPAVNVLEVVELDASPQG